MPNPPQPPPPPPSASSASAAAPASAPRPHEFDIAEEYGTAKKNLPPAGIIIISLVVVVAIAAAYALTHRAHALSSGSIDDVVATQIPNQTATMVAINVSLHNNEQKPAWIKSISASIDVNGTTHSGDAAPQVDAENYFSSFPDLKKHALPILKTETQINPGQEIKGTVVVSFPVSADDFAKRKSLSVTITPYNEVPVVLTK